MDRTGTNTPASPMVTMRGVRFTYPVESGGSAAFSLEIDDLEIPRSARIACIGPSGSGKTTLINLMTGILASEAGSIELNGKVLSRMGEAATRALRISSVGMVFQSFELLDYLTAEQNILLPYSINPVLRFDRAARDRARELAIAMGIEHVLKRRPERLSQGERQRVAICRALIVDPPLVIGDEPTGNLDPTTAERILHLLFEQTAERGATLLMVTHNHGLLNRFDDVIDVTSFARLRPVAGGQATGRGPADDATPRLKKETP